MEVKIAKISPEKEVELISGLIKFIFYFKGKAFKGKNVTLFSCSKCHSRLNQV